MSEHKEISGKSEDINISEIIKIRYDKLDKLKEEHKNPYETTSFDTDSFAAQINNNFEDYEEKEISIAGRVMAKRGQGKVSFYDLLDSSGRIQLFIKQDLVGEEKYEEIKDYDIGDIIGVSGIVFKTKMGQISIRVLNTTMLSKSLKVLPEKYHGLKDPDLRYRQRYIDLIVNPEVKEIFLLRYNVIKHIRKFMDNRGFVEVETPVLSTVAGGANAKPFVSHHNALDIPMYMRIALELPLKRLIVGGFDKVYELGRVFRNEGMDTTHNPEFTMMESYEAYVDYNSVMKMIEDLFAYVAEEVTGGTKISYQGQSIELKAPYAKAKMTDLIYEHTGIDFDLITDYEEALKAASKLNINVENGWGIGKIIEEAFDNYVEDKLIQPTFVTHHPVEISPLAKKDMSDERYTQRFELFINGKEYSNGFSELNDPIDQKERFLAQMTKKAQGDEETHPYDKDFINALEVGLPPTGGVGVGIDRLVMLLADQSSIRDVILFPTMKPID
jgi:lysyl-tRNA synthetase class 2